MDTTSAITPYPSPNLPATIVEKRKATALSQVKSKKVKSSKTQEEEIENLSDSKPFLIRLCVPFNSDEYSDIDYNVTFTVLLENEEVESEVTADEFDEAEDLFQNMVDKAYGKGKFSRNGPTEPTGEKTPELNKSTRIHVIVDKNGECVESLGDYQRVDFDRGFDEDAAEYKAFQDDLQNAEDDEEEEEEEETCEVCEEGISQVGKLSTYKDLYEKICKDCKKDCRQNGE